MEGGIAYTCRFFIGFRSMSELGHNANYQYYRQRVSDLCLGQIYNRYRKICKNAPSNKIVSNWYKNRTIDCLVLSGFLSGFCLVELPKDATPCNSLQRYATIGLNKLGTIYA